jgi:hypothetical protein
MRSGRRSALGLVVLPVVSRPPWLDRASGPAARGAGVDLAAAGRPIRAVPPLALAPPAVPAPPIPVAPACIVAPALVVAPPIVLGPAIAAVPSLVLAPAVLVRVGTALVVPVGAGRAPTVVLVLLLVPVGRWALVIGPVPVGTRRRRRHPDPAVRVELPAGPLPLGRLGPRWRGLWRRRRSRPQGRGGRWVRGRAAGQERVLPGRARLRGQRHAAPAGRLGLAARPRPGRAAPGGAGAPAGVLRLRGLDLDGGHRARLGDRRVEQARDRAVERLHQQLAAGEHRRRRGRRQRGHRQGDNHRCIATRRHAA